MLCQYDALKTCKQCGHIADSLPLFRNCPAVVPPYEIEQSAKATHERPLLTYGPGTELSRLLKRFGIEPTPNCACRAKAAEMDAWGCDECERPERIAEVVAVMRAEAKDRGLPFLDVAARLLVRHAIRNARKLGPPALPESS